MNERRRQSDNFIASGGMISIFLIVTNLLMYIRQIPLTNFIGDEGNGIYGGVYELFFVFVLITSYHLPLIISRMISVRINRGQYKNAKRVYTSAMLFVIVFSFAITLISLIAGGILTEQLLLIPFSKFAITCLAPALIFIAMSSVLQGYFQGVGTMMPTCTSKVLGQIIQFVMCLVFAYVLSDYGQKAGVILNEASYKSAFGVSGVFLGMLIGEIFAFLFLLMLYFAHQKTFKKQILLDNTKSLESMGSILKLILIAEVPFLINSLFMRLNILVNQRIFYGEMASHGQSGKLLSQFGVYYGKYHILMQIPLVFLLILVMNFRTVYTKLIARENFHQAKKAFKDALMQVLVIGGVCSLLLTIIGPSIIEVLYKGDSVVAGKMMQTGSFAILLYGLAFLTSSALQAYEKIWLNTVGITIAFVIQSILLKVLLSATELGVQSLVIVNLVFPLIVTIYNFVLLKRFEE